MNYRYKLTRHYFAQIDKVYIFFKYLGIIKKTLMSKYLMYQSRQPTTQLGSFIDS